MGKVSLINYQITIVTYTKNVKHTSSKEFPNYFYFIENLAEKN